ncbi:RNA-directed DNA polymerase, eukaryota, reverse transcriptase zinc-binding domain protein [Tanacetum coccineum]
MQYKIMAKLLANRLSTVLDKLVSLTQSAFISGHQIIDGPLMVSEIIEWYKKQNKRLMIFKVDFKKDFDSISWNYLDSVLYHMGFGELWRSWIRACLQSASTSILVNGSPTPEFSLECGISQGDPLSPFLFILLMEGLHLALEVKVHSHHIKGVTVGNLSLKINISKSNLFGVGVSDDELQAMAHSILVDKFKSKLSTWKASLLFIGGRLTLIKSVLGILGIYYLSLFKASESIINTLERHRARFFWGGYDGNNKMVKLIKAIHGSEAGFDGKGCATSGIWSSIVGTANYLYSYNLLPKDTLKCHLGCGSSIRFWKDLWLGEEPLCSRYDRLS